MKMFLYCLWYNEFSGSLKRAGASVSFCARFIAAPIIAGKESVQRKDKKCRKISKKAPDAERIRRFFN